MLNVLPIQARPTPDRWLFVLHGIYGRGRNWAAVAKRVTERRPTWGWLLVDLRLHGASHGFRPPHTIDACARDVLRLESTGAYRASAILGHSFGGKVACDIDRLRDEPLTQLWVMDSSPDARVPSGDAWRLLHDIRRMPTTFPSREAFVALAHAAGVQPAIGAWMATNLEPGAEGYRWRIDLDGMASLLDDFFARDTWSAIETPRAEQVHVVKAQGSDALTETACQRILDAGATRGQVFLHRVEGGHWMNADNPDAVVDLLVRYLP
ncbi:MAG: alpha/beta hydrolase [Vicinamibacterales bacterium]